MQMYNPPHPGKVLNDLYMKPLKLTQTRLALCLGLPKQTISNIVNGKSAITPTIAFKLAKAFKTTPDLWLGMQQEYDLWTTRTKVRLEEVHVLVG